MKKIDKIIDDNIHNDFSRIETKLENDLIKTQPRKKWNPILARKIVVGTLICSASLVILFPIIMFASIFLRIDDSVKMIRKKYSLNEIRLLEEETFKPLNKVIYPQNKSGIYLLDDEKSVEAISNFGNTITSLMNLKEENIVYSPYSLYYLMSILALFGKENESTSSYFDSLLGLDDQILYKLMKDVFVGNYFCNDNGAVQSANGLFVDNRYTIKQEIIQQLTDLYVEAYSLDMHKQNDVEKMISWVNQKVNENHWLEPNDLRINEDTMLQCFSTLCFENRWGHEYLEENTYQDYFYGRNENKMVRYMNHEIISKVYDYGEYITFRDSYQNGYQIKYIVPEKESTDIHALIENANLFYDDESKIITEEHEGEFYQKNYFVDLSVPEMAYDFDMDFKDILTKLGGEKLFDPFGHAFDSGFENLGDDTSIYLQQVKQKNKISFDLSGTKAKTISIASFGAGAAAPGGDSDTYIVKLNQPFCYIIEDFVGVPLYFGCVNQL